MAAWLVARGNKKEGRKMLETDCIVEDEVYMREELAEMLRSADYEVHEITIF